MTISSVRTHLIKRLPLIISLAACLPLFFVGPYWNSIPLGYAGMFTQMADQIAESNFALPWDSPYYGPGGVPFAYPPFGLYLFALFIKLTGKYYIFLTWAPPLLSWLSLIPVYFLVTDLSESTLAGACAIVIAATSRDMYIAHAMAAGITRAPAFIFCVLSIYFYNRHIQQPARRNILLAGVFFGLTVLSHLYYGLLCFVWIGCWTLLSPNILRRIRDSLVIFYTGGLVASVWVVIILLRHGATVFFNSFNSHGSGGFFAGFSNLNVVMNVLWFNLAPIRSNDVLAILVSVGFLVLIFRKNLAFIVFFLLIALVFPENQRLVFFLGSLMAGIGLAFATGYLSTLLQKWIKFPQIVVQLILMTPILVLIWLGGYQKIKQFTPLISTSTFELAEDAQNIIKPKERYLALVIQDEAEWMPFLLQREPLVAQWGSEWLGTYTDQSQLMTLFLGCQQNQDWPCVEHGIGLTEKMLDYLITYLKDAWLNEQIAMSGGWKEVYSNERYKVWQLVSQVFVRSDFEMRTSQ